MVLGPRGRTWSDSDISNESRRRPSGLRVDLGLGYAGPVTRKSRAVVPAAHPHPAPPPRPRARGAEGGSKMACEKRPQPPCRPRGPSEPAPSELGRGPAFPYSPAGPARPRRRAASARACRPTRSRRRAAQRTRTAALRRPGPVLRFVAGASVTAAAMGMLRPGAARLSRRGPIAERRSRRDTPPRSESYRRVQSGQPAPGTRAGPARTLRGRCDSSRPTGRRGAAQAGPRPCGTRRGDAAAAAADLRLFPRRDSETAFLRPGAPRAGGAVRPVPPSQARRVRS